MKRNFILAAALSAAIALPALPAIAQESAPWYVTGAVGRSKYDIQNYSGDNKDTSYNLGLGYNLSKNVGVEVGYADFGKVSSSGVNGEAKSTYAGVILSAPFADAFSVYGRLAAASTKRNVSGFGFSESDRKTEALWGVGFAYAFQPRLTGTVEYQKLNDSDVSAINVGLRLGF